MLYTNSEEIPEKIYHYTSFEAFEGIVKNGLRFYQATRYSDDFTFGIWDYVKLLKPPCTKFVKKYYRNMKKSDIENVDKNVNAGKNETFMACFSTDQCNEKLWDEYADHGNGVCFALNGRDFYSIISDVDGQNVSEIGAVEYDDPKYVVRNACKYCTNNYYPDNYLIPYLTVYSFIKDSSKSYENEIRVVFHKNYLHQIKNQEKENRFMDDTGFSNCGKDEKGSWVLYNLNNLASDDKKPFTEIWVKNKETFDKIRNIEGYGSCDVLKMI